MYTHQSASTSVESVRAPFNFTAQYGAIRVSERMLCAVCFSCAADDPTGGFFINMIFYRGALYCRIVSLLRERLI